MLVSDFKYEVVTVIYGYRTKENKETYPLAPMMTTVGFVVCEQIMQFSAVTPTSFCGAVAKLRIVTKKQNVLNFEKSLNSRLITKCTLPVCQMSSIHLLTTLLDAPLQLLIDANI